MRLVVLLCFSCTLYSTCTGYLPRFLHGRPREGFLGGPGRDLVAELNDPPVPPEQWFVQKLDHFHGGDTRTWKQRYFTNRAYYKAGGPIFVLIGGEGPASPVWMNKGAWVTMYGIKYNAYLVQLEHRYYGKSHPTSDLSTENLQYLSSEQALADLANFISTLKKDLNNPKVISFGGSYPGCLSSWFRMKYPHLVDGAVASSAPVLAKVDFFEYLEVVDASLKTYQPAGVCTDPIAQATAAVESNLKTYEGRRKLERMFKLCAPIDLNIAADISNLFQSLAGNFEGAVQYNKDNRAFEGVSDSNITIDTLCNIMSNGHVGTPLERYAKVNSLILDVYGQKCLDYKYEEMIDELRRTEWTSPAAEGMRQWIYQTCTEFAFYQSSDYSGQPFGHHFPIGFSLQQCGQIYGSQFSNSSIVDAVERTNQNYGGLGIKITKVLFPNGSIDPWHALGILHDIGPDARAIFINGTAHCANMYPPRPDDPPGLTKARQEIQEAIGNWLK